MVCSLFVYDRKKCLLGVNAHVVLKMYLLDIYAHTHTCTVLFI